MHGLDFYKMICNDIMHEFETGEFKTFLSHLIRILEYLGLEKVNEMNRRYALYPLTLRVIHDSNRFRLIVPFGRDTIRKISYDVSNLTQLAARDYEDLLQVSFYTRH
jgi:hypothetical protein